MCFPQKTQKEINLLTNKSLKETLKNLLESGKCWIAYSQRSFNKTLEVEGGALLEDSLSEGKGVILFTPHSGNIEILINYLSKNFGCTIPYTPSKIASLDLLVKQARESMGANMVPASSSGIKSLLKTLQKGGLIALASDQVPNKGSGIISTFFGTQALSVSLVASLAKKTKSPCHSIFCLRLPKGRGFKIVINHRISKLNNCDITEGVNLMNRELEKCIMHSPEQYAWEYKRFKHSTFENPY